MRAFLPGYRLTAAASLDDALAQLAAAPGRLRPIAGGTDLMVVHETGKLPEGQYLGLWKLDELKTIARDAAWLRIGALVTYTQLREDLAVARDCPLLCRAAEQIGGIATQNRGTVGGNIANASPAADTPPALLVYDAELEIASVHGRRRIPYASFHRGYKQMDLASDELIIGVWVPVDRAGWRSYYRKVGTRRAQAISKVCAAGAADIQDGRCVDIRFALGSVAPTPLRARRVEDVVRGQAWSENLLDRAQQALDADIAPIDDVRSTATYRRHVSRALLREFLTRAFG